MYANIISQLLPHSFLRLLCLALRGPAGTLVGGQGLTLQLECRFQTLAQSSLLALATASVVPIILSRTHT